MKAFCVSNSLSAVDPRELILKLGWDQALWRQILWCSGHEDFTKSVYPDLLVPDMK